MFGRDGTRKMVAGRISGNYSFPISNFSAGRRAFRSQKFPLGNFATRDLALEAAGTVPLMRDRLRENDTAKAGFMLVFDEQMFDADAAKWWTDLARMDRVGFEKRAAKLVGPQGALALLR